MSRLSLFAVSGLFLAPALALAGAVGTTPVVTATLTVPDAAPSGATAAVNFGQFLSIDASTGSWVVNQASGTTAARAAGVFYFQASPSDAPLLYDRSTGSYTAATGTLIRWNSYLRTDGAFTVSADPLADGNSASSLLFAISANVDPYISYGISVKNSTANKNSYGFTFSESLVPQISGPYTLYSDINGSVVNVGAPLVLSTTGSNPTVQKVLLDDGYGNLVDGGVGVGSGMTYSGIGSAGYTGAGSAKASGAGSFEAWQIQANFSLTGGGDLASLSGYAEITPVPEPGTYAMLGAGLLAVTLVARRRLRG